MSVGSEVILESNSGNSYEAHIAAMSGDLALLSMKEARNHSIQPALVGQSSLNDLWVAPCRPSREHVILTGRVASINLAFSTAEGIMVEALQLTVEQQIGDHSGYSGGPVLRQVGPTAQDLPDEVWGALLEQYPDQANPVRAANVLIAASFGSLLTSFPQLDAIRDQIRTIGDYLKQNAHKAVELENPEGDAFEVTLARAHTLLQRAKIWLESDLIDLREFEIYQVRVRETLIRGLDGA